MEELLWSWGLGSSAASAHGYLLLNLKEGEEQKEVLEAKDNEEKESEVDGEVGDRVTQRAHETWR